MKNLLMLILLACTGLISCESQETVDEELILKYIADNELNANATVEGLYYVIDEEGTGARPDITSTVTVDYEGFTLDGSIFDSSYDRGEPATFPLTNVITGWQLGIPLYREGGSGTLLIPSRMAYGNNPPPGSGIRRNEVLAFDVELHTVE